MHLQNLSSGSQQPVGHLSAGVGRCRSVLLLLMLFLVALTASAQGDSQQTAEGDEQEATGMKGDGTAANPYLISSLADYNVFAEKVNGGSQKDACAKLMADIDTVTVMVGTDDSHRYAGTFDGNHHTLTVAITGSGQYVSPFRFVQGATFQDLVVKGTVHQQGNNTAMYHTSGLLGATYGATLSRVICDVDITFDNSGDAHSGGLVGHAMNSTVTFNDCAFTGSVTEPAASNNSSFGGFVGWCDQDGKFNVTNSYVDMTLTGIGGLNNYVRSETFQKDNSTFTNCFYTLPANTTDWDPEPNTIKVTADQMKSGYVANLLQNAHTDGTMVWGQTITGETADQSPVLTSDEDLRVYKVEYTYNNKVVYTGFGHTGDEITLPADYAKSGVTLPVYLKPADETQLTVTIDDKDVTQSVGDQVVLALPQSDRYTVTATLGGSEITDGATLSGDGDLVFHFVINDGYRLFSADSMVMKKAADTDYAAFTEPATMPQDDKGVYHLRTVADWNTLAQYNPQGDFVMDNDIKTVTTMVGPADTKPFSGNFDGRGHTLDVNISSDQTAQTAPFRNTKNATISNLRVTGTIYSQGYKDNKFAAGLVSSGMQEPLTITGCEVAVTINSAINGDGTHGGIVALNAHATIKNTLFSGSINSVNGATTHSCGGFIGWTIQHSNTTSVDNCLNVGTFNVSAEGGAATFIRGEAKPLTRSYYKNAYGAVQGTHATDEQLTSGELAWTLQHNVETADNHAIAWGQYLSADSADAYPVPTIDEAKRVYRAQFAVDGKVVFTSYANPGRDFPLPTKEQLDVTDLTIPEMKAAEKDTLINITAENTFTIPTGDNFTVKVRRGGVELKGGEAINMTDELTYTVTANDGWHLLTDATFTLKGNEPFPAPALLPVNEDGFVKIASVEDWDKLAANYTGNAANYVLTKDIDGVTTMVGSADKPFTGTFDGQNHTITLNYDFADKAAADQDKVGPFRYASGATITNLRVAGKVNTRKTTNDVGGIIGNITSKVKAATTLTNCVSSIENTFNAPNDATNGGLIGRLTDGATVTIENCAFTGKHIATNGGNSFGGFIGYVDDGAQAAYVKNSLVAAEFRVGGASDANYGNAPFARRNARFAGKINITNSYYLQQAAFQVGGQGIAETEDSIKAGAVAHHLQATQAKPDSMVWGQNLTAAVKDVLPVLTTVDSLRVFQAKFSDKHSDKVYYTYANAGQKFPVPTPAELGVTNVATTYDSLPATKDILCDLDAYSQKLELNIPAGEGYVVTVTRDGKELKEGDELYDTDVLVYHVKAAEGYKLLTAAEVTLKATDTFADPVVLTTDKQGYALIKTDDDWNKFAVNSTSGNYRLAADITADSIAGTKEKPFTGIFDGQRHSIKVNFNMPGKEDVAPFSIIRDAVIKNLIVWGETRTNVAAGDAAGVVGEAYGTDSLLNVHASTDLYWEKSGNNPDMTTGGLVGRVCDNTRLVIDNCRFSGAVIGPEGNSVGGFIGWANAGNVNVTISNSLMVGSFDVQQTNNGTGNQTFVRRDRAQLTITNSYYEPFQAQQFTDQGIAVSDSLLKSGTVAYLLQGSQDSLYWGQNMSPSLGDSKPQLTNDATKRVYRVAYVYGGTIVYADYGNTGGTVDLPAMDWETDIAKFRLPDYLALTGLEHTPVEVKDSDVTLSLDGHLQLHLPEGDRYTVTATLGENDVENGGVLTGEGDLVFHIAVNEGYKLFSTDVQTMKTDGSDFAAFAEPALLAVDADGTCRIDSLADWNIFAANATDGNYRLTADIDGITTMAGQTVEKAFKGTLDGQGHKLTVKYDVRGQQQVAPFRFANGATFKNLHIAGNISSDQQFSGGFVGEIVANGQPVTFTDCHSSVDMRWQGASLTDMTWGGFVGVSRSGASFDNCLFDGSLGDYMHAEYFRAYNTGGFLGWTDRPVTIKNSVVAADIWSRKANYITYQNATFGRSVSNGSQVTVENCYYLDNKIAGERRRYILQGKALNSNDAQLTNGELAYTLQAGRAEQHWGQAIGTDTPDGMPVLTADPAKHVFKNVYDAAEGEEATAVYANTFNVDETKGNNANIAANANGTGNVKLSRTFAEGWNTLVLPFNLTTEEVNNTFGEDTKVAYFTNTEENTIELNTSDSTKDIKANVPVLILPADKEAKEFTFESKTVKQNDGVVIAGAKDIEMRFSYAASLIVPKGDYFINGMNLWESLGETTLQATRAYFHANDVLKGKLRLVIDGEEMDTTTGINGVRSEELEVRSSDSGVFTLAGQKVANSLDEARQHGIKQGVYIVNGKKIVIK